MKKASVGFFLGVFVVSALRGEEVASTWVVVKQTDMVRNVEYRVMTDAEYKTLEQQVRKEAALFPKAEELAKKDWKADETTRKEAFPSSRINPPKVEVVDRTTDRERAEKRAEAGKKAEERKNEPRKTSAKPTEMEKKMAAEKAEEERLVAKAAELVKAKLAELMKPAAETPAN